MRNPRSNTLSLLKTGSEWNVSSKPGQGTGLPSMQMQLNAGKLKLINSQSYQKNLRCSYLSCGCRKNSFIWISPEKKSVYFEVPKVASSSIRKLLGMGRPDINQAICQVYLEAFNLKRFRADIYCDSPADYDAAMYSSDLLFRLEDFVVNKQPRATLKPGYTSLFNTSCFELFYGTLEMVSEYHPDYFTFTLVRNPLDRMVSNWSMFTRKKNRVRMLSELIDKNVEAMGFSEFCDITRRYHNHHWEPQTTYIPFDPLGQPLVDHVARLENLDTDWAPIATRLGIDATIGRENTSIRGDYDEYMTADIREQLLMDYRGDFQNFYPRYLVENH